MYEIGFIVYAVHHNGSPVKIYWIQLFYTWWLHTQLQNGIPGYCMHKIHHISGTDSKIFAVGAWHFYHQGEIHWRRCSVQLNHDTAVVSTWCIFSVHLLQTVSIIKRTHREVLVYLTGSYFLYSVWSIDISQWQSRMSWFLKGCKCLRHFQNGGQVSVECVACYPKSTSFENIFQDRVSVFINKYCQREDDYKIHGV